MWDVNWWLSSLDSVSTMRRTDHGPRCYSFSLGGGKEVGASQSNQGLREEVSNINLGLKTLHSLILRTWSVKGLFALGDNFYNDKNWFHWQQWQCFILSLSSSVNSAIGNHATHFWRHKNSHRCRQVRTVPKIPVLTNRNKCTQIWHWHGQHVDK